MKGRDVGILDGPFAEAEVISTYSREQALEDGELANVTEWASYDKGFRGGFKVPVCMTRALWAKVELPKGHRGCQSTRGRAHDVLWMASLAARGAGKRGSDTTHSKVKVGGRILILRATIDGDGVTIGFPSDF